MTPRRRPVPTAGHPTRAAAVRQYQAEHPEADAHAIAAALGCTVRQVWLVQGGDRARPPKGKPPGWRKKTPLEVSRDMRERRRQAGLCIHCGDEPPAAGRVGCAGCLEYNRNRIASYRAGSTAA